MNEHTDTPIYDQAFDSALSMAVDIDDMEQLTILENMNVETAIQPAIRTDVPF